MSNEHNPDDAGDPAVVRITVVDEWDPERESQAEARRRLQRVANEQIESELDRVEDERGTASA